jgi:hypothetical protein
MTQTLDAFSVTPDRKLRFSPHLGQARALRSRKRHVLILAGTQGGKTSFGPVWLLEEIRRCGSGDYIIAAPTFVLLELKLLPEFKRLFETHFKLGRYVASPIRKFVFSESGEQRLFGSAQETPTQIFFGHAQDPDSLESATAKAAWLDEAGQRKFKKASYDAIMRRLAIHRGRVLITTTPYYHGWLKHDLIDKGGDGVEVVRFESRMNPAFSQVEWDEARGRLPAWKFDMFYRALFTKPAGLIYDVFDEDTQVVPDFIPPAEWPRAWGFDFGGVNTASVKLAKSPEGIWHLYREYLAGGLTAKGHAEQLVKNDEMPKQSYGGAGSEDNWRREFTQAGLTINRPPVSEVEVGIDRVYGLIKRHALVVCEGCERVLEELRTYSRKLDENSEPLEDIEDKNKFHLLDALRYIASAIEEPPLTLPPEPRGWEPESDDWD